MLQKWTNNNHPTSNYYQPSTYKGKVYNRKYELSTGVDEAYNYYSQYQGVVQELPKMEIRNSLTPAQDAHRKET